MCSTSARKKACPKNATVSPASNVPKHKRMLIGSGVFAGNAEKAGFLAKNRVQVGHIGTLRGRNVTSSLFGTCASLA